VKKVLIAATLLLMIVGVVLVPLPIEPTSRIVSSIFIARNNEEVFNYVTTPANWPKWHPSSLAVSGATDHSLMTDELVTENYKVAGHTGTAVWTVVERSAPNSWTITANIGNRNAGQVRYDLSPENGGTRFTREFLYHPRSLLTMALDRFSIRAQIEAESAQAVQQLKEVLEGRVPTLKN
jgi:uncharacterized protein YndB with AHSA1/START domain